MPPLCGLKRSHPVEEWGPTPTPGLVGNWWAVSRSLASLYWSFPGNFNGINNQHTAYTKEADSFQSLFMKSQNCITADVCVKCEFISSELWGWGPGEAIWDTHSLLASWRMRRGSHTQLTKQSHSHVLESWFLLERAGSKPPMGGLVSGLGDWIPWDLDPSEWSCREWATSYLLI